MRTSGILVCLLSLSGVTAFQQPTTLSAVRPAATAARPETSPRSVELRRSTVRLAAAAPVGDKRSLGASIPPVLGGLKAGFKKLCVITGASSGLGRETARVLAESGEYFVICAVRDPAKMKAVAAEMGMKEGNYAILELNLASLASVRKFVFNLKAFKSNRPLDRLVCNAAVYLPTDPKPAFTEDGYEMSMAVNHLGHFLLCNLLLEDMAKAKDARMIVVGSITGNSNTVGGGLVYPRADVGNFEGWRAGGKNVDMVDGKPFLGAKAYKDSKICNMMTVNELHSRFHDKTGITFSTLYPGCIAETALFREKRPWFRKAFPVFMKYVTGGYVGQEEAGGRLAEVVSSDKCRKSGVYWSWNGGAKTTGLYDPKSKTVVGAGGSGGDLFENELSNQVSDRTKSKTMFELSSELVGCEWPDL